MNSGADESQSQWQLLRENQVQAVATKNGVRLVSDNEHNVRWNAVRSLVALLLKGDAGARLPAPLHRDRQDLLAEARCVRVVVHDATRDLHLLHTAVVDFLEREHEVTLDRQVLLLASASGQSAEVFRFVKLGMVNEI